MRYFSAVFALTFLSHIQFGTQQTLELFQKQLLHQPKALDLSDLFSVQQLVEDISVFNTSLDNILIPRVVGTPGHEAVRKFIKDDLQGLGWTVTEDSFADTTPIGVLNFHNIIATHNSSAKKFLDLACHYDSKLFSQFEFLGATDSAVPCAIMIQLAHSLQDRLTKHSGKGDLSLRLIFFDGEEAFVTWTKKDSIYGSRHLAKKWSSESFPEGGEYATQLERTNLLVLLDLLGTKNPSFYNFFPNTHLYYKTLVNAESKLNKARLLKTGTRDFFQRMSTDSSIEDDHVPFLKKGVAILHLIPMPFPTQWHTKDDNRKIIHYPTVHNLIRILAVFVAEYLHLSG